MSDAILRRLRSEFHALCRRLGTHEPFQTVPMRDGSAHVEVKDGEFHYVVTERGTEFERRTTRSEDELLYWLVSSVAFSLACAYELEHRVEGQSFRRILFAKLVEFMGQAKPEWAQKKRDELETILARRPYDDDVEG